MKRLYLLVTLAACSESKPIIHVTKDNICDQIATAACYEDANEGLRALGPIFRRVFWFSVMGAAFIGLIALLQAYVFPGVIPP